MNLYKEELIKAANKLDVYDISAVVISDPRFELWSGSGKAHQHHYGKGGLIRHTYEVVNLCLANMQALDLLDIDPIEIYLSALFHDCGKMWDYEPIYKDVSDPRKNESKLITDYCDWTGTSHKRLIHHISRSALRWNEACSQYSFKYGKYADSVTHNILSHHGCREYGSPVAPKTKAAWLLHLCDGISARMDDADKMDLLKEKQ